MALCPKCGAQVADDAKFCGSCGATITPSAATPAVPPSQSPPHGPASSGTQGGMAPNVAALLVYVPICLVGVVCAILFAFILDPYKKDRFIRFHAWQSLALHVCWIGFWVVWMVVAALLTALVHLFALLAIPVYFVMIVGWLGLMIFLMIKANGMQTYKVPVIGDWAEKQANG